MTLEELISKIKREEAEKKVDKDSVIEWLIENFRLDREIPKEFNKIAEMERIVNLLENRVMVEAEDDIAKIIIYAIALANFKKDKIDIFKLSDVLGIDNMNKEN